MSFSTQWDPKAAASWKKIRDQGKARYVFLRWVMCWGIGTAALFWIVERFWRLPDHLGGAVFIVFPLAGIYAGSLPWNVMDAGYRNYLSRQEVRSLNATL